MCDVCVCVCVCVCYWRHSHVISDNDIRATPLQEHSFLITTSLVHVISATQLCTTYIYYIHVRIYIYIYTYMITTYIHNNYFILYTYVYVYIYMITTYIHGNYTSQLLCLLKTMYSNSGQWSVVSVTVM